MLEEVIVSSISQEKNTEMLLKQIKIFSYFVLIPLVISGPCGGSRPPGWRPLL